MSDNQEEPKPPEMTAEQKAVMEAVKQSVSKFQHMMSFYLFNQLQIIENGEIRILLTIKNRQIDNIELHSFFSRDLSNGKKD